LSLAKIRLETPIRFYKNLPEGRSTLANGLTFLDAVAVAGMVGFDFGSYDNVLQVGWHGIVRDPAVPGQHLEIGTLPDREETGERFGGFRTWRWMVVWVFRMKCV